MQDNDSQQLDLSFDELTVLKLRLTELEQQKTEMLEALEQSKAKARSLLTQRDIQIQRLKMTCSKFESYLKSTLSHDEINKIGQLKEEELLRLQEYETEIDIVSKKEIGEDRILSHGGSNGSHQNTEYIKNVFVKYLEYLAQNNKKEIITIEHVLFTELGLTREECSRLDHLRRQNTFWKKILPFQGAVQPLVTNKFSAGELKKKLFGGMAQFMAT